MLSSSHGARSFGFGTRSSPVSALCLTLLCVRALAACSASPAAGAGSHTDHGSGVGAGAGSSGVGSAGNSGLLISPDSGTALNLPPDGGSSNGDAGADAWPSACKTAPVAGTTGEYCQGAPFAPTTQGTTTIESAAGCGTTLWGIARDFIGYNQMATSPAGTPHPDFGSHYCCGNPTGTVLATLGDDGKPVYNPANVAGDYSSGVGLSGPDAFKQWYNDVPGVNLAYLVGFNMAPSGDGVTSVFASKLYFPVDGVGFGNFNDYGEDGKSHNFGFTTELHTKFKYQGGEVFSFEGDDDLWVFINKKLAIDLGGIHTAMQGQITLDKLAPDAGLVIGQVYPLDLFNAERHPSGSNFKITTSMTFVDCGVDPVVVR